MLLLPLLHFAQCYSVLSLLPGCWWAHVTNWMFMAGDTCQPWRPQCLLLHLGLYACWPSTCEPVHLLNVYFCSCTCFQWLCNKLLQTCFNTTQNYHLSFCGSGILVQCDRMLCSGPYKAEIKSHSGSVSSSEAQGPLPSSPVVGRIQFFAIVKSLFSLCCLVVRDHVYLSEATYTCLTHDLFKATVCVFKATAGKSVWFVPLSSRTAITRDHLIRSDPVTCKEIFSPKQYDLEGHPFWYMLPLLFYF